MVSPTPQMGTSDPRGALLKGEFVGLDGLNVQQLLVTRQDMSTGIRPLSGEEAPLWLLKTLSCMHPQGSNLFKCYKSIAYPRPGGLTPSGVSTHSTGGAKMLKHRRNPSGM